MSPSQPHGVLLIDKPIGLTSFDVIRRLRRLLKTKKIGHAGTLDPFATGLLVICVGHYTRFAGYLTDDDKKYRATLQFGVETNTDDLEGEALHQAPIPEDLAQQIPQILPRFRGDISQIPPAFSAIHIDGERAYKRARKGEDVEMPARNVTIHTLECIETTETRCVLEVVASKGTYIRALGRDIGRAVGSRAHLTALRRIRSGPFHIDEALTLEELDARVDAGEAIALKQNAEALRTFTSIVLDDDAVQKLTDGKILAPPPNHAPGVYAAYAQASEQLVGLIEIVDQHSEDEGVANVANSDSTRVLKVKRLLPTA